MIFDRNLPKYLIAEDEMIYAGLAKIETNESGIIFCVSSEGELSGVFTDGDFRRWAMSGANVDLNKPLSDAMNRCFISASIRDSADKIMSLCSERVRYIPLLDERLRCNAIVRPRQENIFIAQNKIGPGNKVFVIAEIGNNHNGDPELARLLVDEAVKAGADCVKFQLRDMESLYINSGDANDAREDLGSQYTLDLLSRFQLSSDKLFKVFDYCRGLGVLPLCTPWDPISAKRLIEYGVEAFKVASADLTNPDLLKVLARTGKPLICSTGMSTDIEITASIRLLNELGAEYSLLHCNSTYPAPFRDLNLAFMQTLRNMGKCPVGYSSHDRGYSAVIAAVALGANIIEKHFTLDRTMEGVDHRVSLMPAEFSAMVSSIRQVEEAIGHGGSRHLSQGEKMNRESLGKSLVVNKQIKVGTIIESSMIEVRSPGRGLPPYRKSEVIGRITKRPLEAGDALFETDISDVKVGPRDYQFRRPFGIPVRYHDLQTLGSQSNFDVLEFHLSYKDLEVDISKFIRGTLNYDLIVHAPELFAGDHLLDLCSRDEDYRRHSIHELERVVDITRKLQNYFPKTECPRIIVNVGGFTQDEPLSISVRKSLYEIVIESLAAVDLSGVEILPQTMPPFPWHFGGQRYQNLFVDPKEIAEFCSATKMRVCLDTSHSKLSCTHNKWSFAEFIKVVGPHTAHLHIADARGVDGEGLQIADGEIILAELGELLDACAPNISFIPEIWQGHKNGGEGFWVALERLESYL